ncbi:thymidine phosphorylase [Clostridium vitabionis]|uniref:thymidine phosphorylase n=1 Tax=Clostridium vitabionis TaxID=2784388 RepID=UPI00188A526F|nr:thymidine phosphorylase [Clostridium vitabionis]
MRMYDLIEKKKHGRALSREEIREMISGFVSGDVPDYQMSAMAMAIWFMGMSDEEITELTLAMADSGEKEDLSPIRGFKADKHSTGGVGDKTTLICGPVAAALGVRVAKMSGRGLGFTGGTIDKLEAIPGFSTEIAPERFFALVNRVGIAVVGQSGNLVPADKKLYALRDVTATVDSIPLIASSIMSKKLAGGADGIVLDVKTGSGAFMKTMENSVKLAETMVRIGTMAGRTCTALITDMDVPLGHAIGNALEVREALEVLQNHGPADLREVSLRLAAEMLHIAGKGSPEECFRMAEGALRDGSAMAVFRRMAAAQGGSTEYLDGLAAGAMPEGEASVSVASPADGFISAMDTEGIGTASVLLHAGRSKKGEEIDHGAGIILRKKYGDRVKKGEPVATLYAADPALFGEASARFLASLTFAPEEPPARQLVYARVGKDGLQDLSPVV